MIRQQILVKLCSLIDRIPLRFWKKTALHLFYTLLALKSLHFNNTVIYLRTESRRLGRFVISPDVLSVYHTHISIFMNIFTYIAALEIQILMKYVVNSIIYYYN